MRKPIFTEAATDYLVMPYDPELLKLPGFGDKLNSVLGRVKQETEDGERICEYIEHEPGQIFIKFLRFAPLRVIQIRFNRIEKELQDLTDEQAAA